MAAGVKAHAGEETHDNLQSPSNTREVQATKGLTMESGFVRVVNREGEVRVINTLHIVMVKQTKKGWEVILGDRNLFLNEEQGAALVKHLEEAGSENAKGKRGKKSV
jgi:hypothetical protein